MGLTIGQFNESFPPIIDGVANVVQNYAYWLNKKHGSCCVITPKHPDADDTVFDFDVHRFASIRVPTRGEYRFGFPQMSTSFWMSLKKIPFDIVHAHCPFSTGLAARSLARRNDIPFVATFHSKYRDDFLASVKSEVIVEGMVANIVRFFESADEVWTANDASEKTLREYGFEGSVHIVELGCDIDMQYPSQAALAAVDAAYGLEPGIPLFIYVGQHVWQKNLKMVVEALALLASRGYKFHMLFVGDGPQRPDMKKMVKASGLSGLVSFAGNVHDRGELARIYLRSSAMLFPSVYDTSALVRKEAAACGCPVVLVRDSNAAQDVTEQNGFLINNSPEALAAAAAHIIEDPQHARQVGAEARRTLYTAWEDAVEEAAARYLYLIARKNKKQTRHA